ncbi:hypothetical protein RDABS01_010857 [Bienertia sinuspersici]
MSKKEREVVDLRRDEKGGGGNDKRNRVDDDGDTVIGRSNYTFSGTQKPDGEEDEKKAKFKMLQVLMSKLNPLAIEVKQIKKLCNELYSED